MPPDSTSPPDMLYRQLFLELDQAVAIVNDDAVYVDANPAAAGLFGVAIEDLLGKTIRDFTAESIDFEREWAAFHRYGSGAGGYRIQRPDGEFRELEYSSVTAISPGYHAAIMRDVTEQRRLERELRQSEERFRDLVENAADIIYTIDNDGRFLSINEAGPAILGFTVDELLAMRVDDLALSSNEQSFRVVREAKARGERSTTYHADLLTKDGAVRTLEVTSRLIYDAKGNAIATQGIARDITERQREDQDLREREAQLRTVLETMSCAVCISDGENLLLWNAAMRELTGHADDKIGASGFLASVMHAEDFEVLTGRGRARMEGEAAPSPYRVRFTHAGGEERWAEIHSSRTEYAGVAAVLVVAFDVTESHHAEEALRTSEERLRTVVEGMPVGTWMFDGERIVLVNAGLCDMTGYSRDQLLQPGFFRGVLHPDDREWMTEVGRQRLRGEPASASYEARLVRSDGEVRWIQVQATRVDEYRGRPATLVACIDITERLEAEAERRRFEEQMQHAQKLESLGVLAGGIAHDFNNLLVGVLGNADIALGEMAPGAPARPVIENIQLAATRAADLTRQMLAYSGKGRFVVEPLNVSHVVEEMAHLLEVSISKRAILRYDFDANLPPVQADATQLRQVVMNLITNASDALGDREGVISIRTSALYADREYLHSAYLDEDLPEGHFVSLEVTDTGDGMDEATRRNIFDPFFTTKFTGRGLGLAAVLGIVRGHQGAIKVYSEPGRGTTFKVLLPAAGGEMTANDEGQQRDAWNGTGNVLLIDDDETVRSVTERMVRKAGFAVESAADGAAGLAAFEAARGGFAVVILDLTMPGIDGREVFRQLRQMDPSVRVILTSGFNEQDATDQFAGKGLAGFLQKPYRSADLMAKLREAIDGPSAAGADGPHG